MHTAIFDLGKTNKKCFLFDGDFREVFREYTRFDEIADEDGFPADDLERIHGWLRELFDRMLRTEKFDVQRINFSTYGATLVHLDARGEPLTPLYNYLKPYPASLIDRFTEQYGDVARATGSPEAGFLNSGLHLYWLKHRRPEVWKRVRWSLHFPQYLSYLFTGVPVSDYTSTGCHTSLWDYEKRDYHAWVYAEGIDQKLPPLVTADTSINVNYDGRKLGIGVGIHDSSSALLPYLRADRKPFLLISTGTWSIALNPFASQPLTDEDMAHGTLQYLRLDGLPVRATRLFLGNEFSKQTAAIAAHFGLERDAVVQLPFDPDAYATTTPHAQFRMLGLPERPDEPLRTELHTFRSASEAYHQLMRELTAYQIGAARRAMGGTRVRKIYIDGGFADNPVFTRLLAGAFPEQKIRTTQTPLGSALGAAAAVGDASIGKKFLKRNYRMRKVTANDERAAS